MASGDTLFILTPRDSIPTATAFATLSVIADTSTPATATIVLDFDTGTDEHADWHVTVPSHYDGGGFDISFKGGPSGTDTGVFELEIRCKVIDDATALSGDLLIDGQTPAAVTDTPPATANALNYSAEVALTHADADSPAVGEYLIIRATRDVSVGSDNTGDLRLAEILIKET